MGESVEAPYSSRVTNVTSKGETMFGASCSNRIVAEAGAVPEVNASEYRSVSFGASRFPSMQRLPLTLARRMFAICGWNLKSVLLQ